MENPPEKGDRVKIFNQVTEVHTVRDLAKLVSEMTGAEIEYLDNPRNEAPENELKVKNDKFLELGLNPTTLSKGLMKEVTDIARKYAYRCDKAKIMPTSKWK